MALSVAAYAIYVDSLLHQFEPPQPRNQRELMASGKRADNYSDLIEKLSRDLKARKGVELVLQPALIFPSASLEESKLVYYVLIGEGFFLSLPEPEQRALIAHEMGHIIFVPPVCANPINCQVGADLIAALYTSPETVISLLSKLSVAPHWTESQEYRIRLEHLKLLLPEQGR
ncbi:MAG: hypothetical protein WD989_01420 [Candidatus Paceibacterota bacterium]